MKFPKVSDFLRADWALAQNQMWNEHSDFSTESTGHVSPENVDPGALWVLLGSWCLPKPRLFYSLRTASTVPMIIVNKIYEAQKQCLALENRAVCYGQQKVESGLVSHLTFIISWLYLRTSSKLYFLLCNNFHSYMEVWENQSNRKQFDSS